jgi:hypothetical protein
MPVVGQVLDVADRRVALERVDARQPGARSPRSTAAATRRALAQVCAIATSTRTFLLISARSMSTWIFLRVRARRSSGCR